MAPARVLVVDDSPTILKVVSAILARGTAAREALAPFAKHVLRRGAIAWALAFLVAAAPIARFAIVSGGASLFRDSQEHTR